MTFDVSLVKIQAQPAIICEREISYENRTYCKPPVIFTVLTEAEIPVHVVYDDVVILTLQTKTTIKKQSHSVDYDFDDADETTKAFTKLQFDDENARKSLIDQINQCLALKGIVIGADELGLIYDKAYNDLPEPDFDEDPDNYLFTIAVESGKEYELYGGQMQDVIEKRICHSLEAIEPLACA